MPRIFLSRSAILHLFIFFPSRDSFVRSPHLLDPPHPVSDILPCRRVGREKVVACLNFFPPNGEARREGGGLKGRQKQVPAYQEGGGEGCGRTARGDWE